MRFFRLLATSVVLLVLFGGLLGTACTGAKGERGENGADGVGIEDVVNNANGTITVILTNGEKYTSDNLTGPQGAKGDKGDTGPQGPQGIQGTQGPPGPNTIAAMGNIAADCTIIRGYNVTSCIWEDTYARYRIALTGISYSENSYVTMVTPELGPLFLDVAYASYGQSSDNLIVQICDQHMAPIRSDFSFVVLGYPDLS